MASNKTDEELLAELDNLGGLDSIPQEPPKSRPHTPRVAGSTTAQGSPKKAGISTPPLSLPTRTSEEKGVTQTRRSGDSTRSFHQSFTPGTETEESYPQPEKRIAPVPEPKQQSTGSWWGGLVATASATASAAVKQAESLAKEIQKNEEAQRWAEQVKGNVGALRGLGMRYLTPLAIPN
jgi:hypothetical protein